MKPPARRRILSAATVVFLSMGCLSISAAAQSDPNAPKGQCADRNMLVSVQQDPEAAGAGQRRAFVVIENIGSKSCTLRGYPGVSFVAGDDGHQVGPAVPRTGPGKVVAVTVKRGGVALAPLNYSYVDKNAGNLDNKACKVKHARGYRVYPPHSFKSVYTPYSTYACTTKVHWITLGPVTIKHQPGFTPALGK